MLYGQLVIIDIVYVYMYVLVLCVLECCVSLGKATPFQCFCLLPPSQDWTNLEKEVGECQQAMKDELERFVCHQLD